ncbi:unnamed protein product [Closterium sp. NIES-54]
MEIACTSMIHAHAPHFLWPYAVTVDLGSVGAGGVATRGTGAGGAGFGGASSGGAGAGVAGTGGASSGFAGAGGAGTRGASSGGARAGGDRAGGASSEETDAGGSTTAPPHRHDTRLQAARRREREEQQQHQEQQQQQSPQLPLLQQLFPPLSGLRALGLPSSPPVHSQSPTTYGPTFPPLDPGPAVFSPQSQSPPPVLLQDWTAGCPPRACPSSPCDDLSTVLFRSSPRRAPHVSVLLPPPTSCLAVSSHPITDFYRATRPVIFTSLFTNPHASPSSVLALTVAVADFTATCRLDFATRVVTAPPARPLAPREWHDTLRNSLAARKFCPLSADPSLFVRSGPTPFFVLVYVDDLVQQVLQQFELQHSTTQPTPLAVEHRLNGPFPDESFESSGPNAELVGCLYELRILALVVSSRLFKYSRNEQGVNRTHGRKGGAQSPMAPKKAMVRNLPKGLGEQISQVAVKSHILHIELLKLDKVTDKEVPNFDVLGASVVYEILGEVDAALIVTPEGGSGLRVAKLLG